MQRLTHLFSPSSLLTTVAIGLGSLGAIATPASAVELPDGTIAFEAPPRFVALSANHPCANVPSNYYFTLEVPESAGEALKQVTVTQPEGAEALDFNFDASVACEGGRGGRKIALERMNSDPNNDRSWTFSFDRAIEPGEKVTIRLHTDRNPELDGFYLFGVTAFPEGEQVRGQFLGLHQLSLDGGS